MRSLVIYYSRTGTTRTAAVALAELLGAETAEIRCDRYASGALGYIRAAIDSVRGARSPIEEPAAARASSDLVVICAPLWTGYPAVPIRSFLAGRRPFPGRVALILTHLGSPSEKAFTMLEADLARPAEVKLALRQSEIQEGKAATKLREFAEHLRRRDAA